MRLKLHDMIEKCRYNPPGQPEYHSDRSFGLTGIFLMRHRRGDSVHNTIAMLRVMSSEGSKEMPWEHVSVSVMGQDRCPTWEEICLVKEAFWLPGEVVIQYHPKDTDYRNLHQYCLHLWKPIGIELPTPPPIAVAPKPVATTGNGDIHPIIQEVCYGRRPSWPIGQTPTPKA